MGSAVSNTVRITTGLPLAFVAGDDFSGDMGYIGAGNPSFPPVGALVPSDGTISGWPVNAVMIRTSSGNESFEFVLTGAPAETVWSLSFVDDLDVTWSFSNDTPGIIYSDIAGYGFWVAHLAGPAFPALTTGHTYQLTVPFAGVAAPVLAGLLNQLGDQILLSWTCATGGITAYLLYKNANNNGFALYQTLDGSITQFLDIITDDPVDVIDSAVYYVVAQVGAAQGGPSNFVDNEVPNARI